MSSFRGRFSEQIKRRKMVIEIRENERDRGTEKAEELKFPNEICNELSLSVVVALSIPLLKR